MGDVKNGETETNRHESFWEGLVNRTAVQCRQKQIRSVLNVELKTRLVPLGVRVVEEKEAEVDEEEEEEEKEAEVKGRRKGGRGR